MSFAPPASPSTPTIEQQIAIDSIRHWLRTHYQRPPVFALIGLAGTGKTSVIKFLLSQIRPDLPGNAPAFLLAPTARAGLVLSRRASYPVCTLHSIMYGRPHVIDAAKEEADRQAALQAAHPGTSQFTPIAPPPPPKKQERLQWSRRENSPLTTAGLIVVDEASMVGTKLARDLLAYNKPILAVGDPGQLPPVKDVPGLLPGTLSPQTPGYMLNAIQRQAQGNPIISLAHAVRNGASLWAALSTYADGYHVQQLHCPTYQHVLSAYYYAGTEDSFSPILTFTHDERINLNAILFARYATHPQTVIPCRVMANRDEHANGEIIFLPIMSQGWPNLFYRVQGPQSMLQPGPISPTLTYTLRVLERTAAAKKCDSSLIDSVREDPNAIPLDLGFAVTIHAAQGSSWPVVFLRADRRLLYGTSPFFRQLVYTAITRAEQRLVVIT